MKQTCIFCALIHHEIPANFVQETNELIVIKDIAPKAETHLLILPKKHIDGVQVLKDSDEPLVGKMMMMAQQLSNTLPHAKDFRLIINSGMWQHVPHLHMHFLAGKLSSC